MKYYILAATILLSITSCRTTPKDTAGKGGSASIIVYPQHHQIAKRLINGKVYVRYNTLDVPTSGVYDDSMICSNHDSLISCTFTGLKNGNYYFYATGYDTSISQAVKGGSPYTITAQTTQSFNLPVSEN